MENKLPKPPEHIESLLKQLEQYPILVLSPANKNKVNIIQILKYIPNKISKIILSNVDTKTAEEAVNYHNYKITTNNKKEHD